MTKKLSMIIIGLLLTAGLITGCLFGSDDDGDSKPCMCFQNDSNYTIAGIRYRKSGSTTWIPEYFDDSVSSGEGFDCDDGKFDSDMLDDDEYYDFQIFSSGGYYTVTWEDVPYKGGNIGFVASSTTEYSVYGAVDSDCDPKGDIYYADSVSK